MELVSKELDRWGVKLKEKNILEGFDRITLMQVKHEEWLDLVIFKLRCKWTVMKFRSDLDQQDDTDETLGVLLGCDIEGQEEAEEGDFIEPIVSFSYDTTNERGEGIKLPVIYLYTVVKAQVVDQLAAPTVSTSSTSSASSSAVQARGTSSATCTPSIVPPTTRAFKDSANSSDIDLLDKIVHKADKSISMKKKRKDIC
ncbi:uncharacterized protein [Amphiura filiformis]|uniref:uncharacterized protein n=1 Tax=Amphiura filiformis TaxID=82378 RepID=UPI003B213D61